MVWPGGGDSWRSGGMSPSNAELSSFDVADELLRTFANKNLFPNLKAIVVTGHSAGGQYATRYAMANKVHDTLGRAGDLRRGESLELRVAGCDTALPQDDAEPAAAKDGWSLTPDTAVHTKFTYGPVRRGCEELRELQPVAAGPRESNRLHREDDRRSTQEAARVETDDIPRRPGGHAAARRLRQLVFRDGSGSDSPLAWRGVREVHQRATGRDAPIQVVSECGHNDRCIFTTDAVLRVIFPKY